MASILQLNAGQSLRNFSMSNDRSAKFQLVKSAEDSGLVCPSGRVTHDSRGNAVWHWAIATGVLAAKSVADLITTLDEPGMLALDSESDPQRDWEGDPYNRSVR
jgi:hypothetical protein